MKQSIDWLKDYIDFDKTPEKLADDLSLFGHELESIEKVGDDTVLDLEITPNRGDCLSILGIAREVAALYNVKIKNPNVKIDATDVNKNIDIKIDNPEVCQRFTARIIDNIKIGQSPEWMQKRLASYGFRPINNIVDVTNYVMVATGQPLHAFDYDKIKDGIMRVRLSKKGEEVMTLDGVNRVLPEGAIVIEDDEKIYDLAGIMGGYRSEVDEKTKTIILQGAIFDPVLIRRASKYLKHQTDASYRYERGVDFEGTILGVDLASSLIKETCSEAKVGELINEGKEKPEDREINIDIDKVNGLIGIEINSGKAKEYLERLGFKIAVSGDLLTVSVPSYRAYDVKIWQDLAEEVARMYGYNNIKKVQVPKNNTKDKNTEFIKRESIKDTLQQIGFTEVYSYSFANEDKIKLLGNEIKDCPEIANPLSPETQYLRPAIIPSLLQQISKNPWAPEVNIFEVEKVFDNEKEWWQLGLAVCGKNDNLLRKATEELKVRKDIKTIDQKILDSYKIRRPIKYLVVNLDEIAIPEKNYKYEISKNKYQAISKFPPTVRDLAFIVDNKTDAQTVEEAIKTVNDQILIVELFDEFDMKDGNKNIAYHIWLQDIKSPVDLRTADEIFQNIIKTIEEKFQAKLRS